MTPKVALIPAAGLGTRMLPASRVVPKALITVVDRPALQSVVEEAVRAGAERVVVVVSPSAGQLVESHFSAAGPLPGLEDVTIQFEIQQEALGLGHAVLEAKGAVGEEPFFCLLADNIATPGTDFLGPLAAGSDGRSVVALRTLTDVFLDRYGVIHPGEWLDSSLIEVKGAIEKPGKANAPSRLGLIGRYLFTSEIFDILEDAEPGYGGEIQLTDAIHRLGEAARCRGAVVEADLLDVGNPLGLLEASVSLALASDELGGPLRAFLSEALDEMS